MRFDEMERKRFVCAVDRGDFVFRAEYEKATSFTFKLVNITVPSNLGSVIRIK